MINNINYELSLYTNDNLAVFKQIDYENGNIYFITLYDYYIQNTNTNKIKSLVAKCYNCILEDIFLACNYEIATFM